VHRVAQVDELRQDPQRALLNWFPATVDPPPAVRILMWAFVTNARRDLFRNAAARVFGAGRRA
jgi:hypothetical protein